METLERNPEQERSSKSDKVKKSIGKRIGDTLWKKVRGPVYIGTTALIVGTGVFLGTKGKNSTHVKSIDTTFGELLPAQDRTSDVLLGDKTISFEETVKIKGEQGFTLFGKEIAKDVFGSLDDAERKLLMESLVEFGYKYEDLEKLPIHIKDSTLEGGEKRRLIEMDNISAPDTLKAIFTDQCKIENEDEWYNLSALQDDEFIQKTVTDLKGKGGKEKVYKRFLEDIASNGEEYRLLAAKKLWQMLVKTVNMVEAGNAPQKTMLKLTFYMNGRKYIMTTTDGELFNTAIDTSDQSNIENQQMNISK